MKDVLRLREERSTRESGPWLRYELIDGELVVTPAPSLRHQEAVRRIIRILEDYLAVHRVGHPYISPADVAMGPDSNVEPDVFVAPLVGGRRPKTWDELGPLLLVVEVLSPSTARYDRKGKRALYLRRGVPEYWIVDLDARVVERWQTGDERPAMLAEALRWQPAGATEPLVVDLPAFFAQVLDE